MDQRGSKNKIEFYETYSLSLKLVLCVISTPEDSAEFGLGMGEIETYIGNTEPPFAKIVVVGDFNFSQIN